MNNYIMCKRPIHTHIYTQERRAEEWGGFIIHNGLIIPTLRFVNHHFNAGIDTGGGHADLSRYANHVHLPSTSRPVQLQQTRHQPPAGCCFIRKQPATTTH